MAGHACNTKTQEAEAEALGGQGQTGLHSEFQASPGYTVRPCLKQINKNEKPNV
jgi:hypothetical protein